MNIPPGTSRSSHVAMLGAAVALMLSGSAGAKTPAAAAGAPTPDQVSYWFGVQYGQTLKSVGLGSELKLDEVSRGIKDGLHGTQLTPAQQAQMQTAIRASMSTMVQRNQEAARAFLEKNGREKGVVKTPSGLEYRVIEAGNAKAPAVVATDQVTVQYRGKLLDGTEFDSSYARGTPTTFRVDGVIRGWQEALVLMKPGAKWQLFVPPELAYGLEQKPGIPPGSLLIFDVEMVSAAPAANGAAPAPGTGSK